MDLSILQSLIPDLAGFLNLDPTTVMLYLSIIMIACNIVGRLIPDDKTGILGIIRDACKMIGAYVPNRVTTGVSVNDVARDIVESRVDMPEIIEESVQAFPGLDQRKDY